MVLNTVDNKNSPEFEVTRTCNSSFVTLIEVISSPSGNGRSGVVGILLQYLLKYDEESVASFLCFSRASPKTCMSQLYIAVNSGSVYAARLQEAGYSVTLLARGQRAASLRVHGILLEDASLGQCTTTRVSVIEHLAPTDSYDVVLVAVRMDQLASILPTLVANHQIPTVLFMLNNPAGMQDLRCLEPQRVVLGFPSVGGTRQGEAVRYILIRQQQTTLGKVDGRVTPRLQQLATAFKKAGFSVALSPDMHAWLKTHAVFVSCVSAALATAEGDSVRLGHTRTSVVMMVKAICEGFQALQAQGIPISPFNLKVLFLWMPTVVCCPLLAICPSDNDWDACNGSSRQCCP